MCGLIAGERLGYVYCPVRVFSEDYNGEYNGFMSGQISPELLSIRFPDRRAFALYAHS